MESSGRVAVIRRSLAEELRGEDTRDLMRILESLDKAKKNPGLVALTRNKHYIGGRTSATAATARNVASQIWNPHSTSRIQCFECWFVPTTAASVNASLTRTTARGTTSTSVAVAIANSIANDTAAPSGFALDLAFSVQPTVSAANLGVWMTPAGVGNGFTMGFADPFDITPASGLALITTQAAAFPISDVTWVIGD